MRALLGNILLALVWVLVTGDFTLANLALGMGVGFAGLWLLGDVVGVHRYAHRVGAALCLAALFAWELVRASARVAHDVVTPRLRAQPAIIAVPLEACSDLEVLMLTSLVTLTPGTVVVAVDDDRSHMYVYSMYADDVAADRERIKRRFERGVLGVTRAREDR